MPTSIRSLARERPPRIPWERIKSAILGSRYDLSIVFVGPRRMKELNQTYREKPKTTNVLAFPLSPESGEIFMDQAVVRREAPAWNMTPTGYAKYLYIHALLHLKGFDHETAADAQRMEKAEHQWLSALR